MELHFLGIADLQDRWCYTRQGLHKITHSAKFPEPAATINRGRVRMWHVADIEAFEQAHPEVRDPEAKRRKIIGYARAISKGTG